MAAASTAPLPRRPALVREPLPLGKQNPLLLRGRVQWVYRHGAPRDRVPRNEREHGRQAGVRAPVLQQCKRDSAAGLWEFLISSCHMMWSSLPEVLTSDRLASGHPSCSGGRTTAQLTLDPSAPRCMCHVTDVMSFNRLSFSAQQQRSAPFRERCVLCHFKLL